jgi:large subunit ribosomal protein L18
MAVRQVDRKKARERRHRRVRVRLSGSAERPRLTVFRSLTNTYVQLVDDASGRTLASASTADLKLAKNDLAAAAEVGKAIAGKARQAGIGRVVFDRSGYLYHGRVKALADAAREAGLEF